MYPYQTQTPISYPMPTAIVRTVSAGLASQQIDEMLKALQKNLFVPSDANHPFAGTWNQLEALYDLSENWNGYDVLAPNPDAIEHAKAWLQKLYRDTENENLKWISPHVSANEDGHVAFEWARGRKRLTIYVSSNEAWYIKAWGPHIVNDMTDGEANSSKERIPLWSWLTE